MHNTIDEDPFNLRSTDEKDALQIECISTEHSVNVVEGFALQNCPLSLILVARIYAHLFKIVFSVGEFVSNLLYVSE